MKTSLLVFVLLLAPAAVRAQTSASPKPKPAAAGVAKAPGPAPAASSRPAAAPGRPALNEAQVEARANALTANMQKALALTPPQVEKVRQINLVSVRNVETARHTYRQDMRKIAAVVDDIGQARLAMLKEALTPQQFDKYQRKREEKMGVPSSQAPQGTPAPGLPSRYEE
ncbi:hypothetical protein [Hymenobacter weizhouensis]|uniref:hypothetical protein n=1 Tax=Hymenobacter sp. YIM 151500-1 TaxID=2987689 RepID=UPI0022279C97|nr:hypothetical protein [Hymenobacter sp. YIM 151500-1]UYZ63780.1 hypothetical protein OIS53_02805 [Hymenobacter sp. YIM 151500-1]